MSNINESGYVTRPSAAAIGKYLRVVLNSSGKWALAGAGDAWDGITTEEVFAADVPLAVRLRNTPGTNWGKLSGTGTKGNYVYGAASGLISETPSGPPIGKLFGSGATTEIVEVLYADGSTAGGLAPVVTVAGAGSAQGDAAALTANALNNVTGADGTVGVLLPAAAAGARVDVYNAVATNGLKIYPATGDTINGGSANAAITIEGKTLAYFVCFDATNWTAIFTANT